MSPGLHHQRHRAGSGAGCAVVIVIALVLAVIVVNLSAWGTVTDHTGCQVTGKDRTTNQNGGSDARIYTSCGTFKVADDLLRGRFDSADVYGQIREGQTYDITAAGWRIPLLSQFPNILDARPAGAP